MVEMIRFNWKGKDFQLFEDEIEAAYGYMNIIHMRDDCKRHLYDIWEWCCTDEGCDDIDSAFIRRYGMDYASAEKLIDKMVERYNDKYDCNVSENAQWDMAIKAVLNGKNPK